MKYGHSAESNEKSCIRFFRFLFFELWLIVFTIYDDAPGVSSVTPTQKNRSKVAKFPGKMRNELKLMENQFSDFCDFSF